MSLGVEIAVAVVGLWAVFLRPLIIRYAGEMMEILFFTDGGSPNPKKSKKEAVELKFRAQINKRSCFARSSC
ncbi:hypothetical protein D5086_003493 [Populus alba]|uniref:Uncharacterized protein n=1 Tax=Populus alba TaxID=43335 RepID=A0ACC4D4H1_POPAL